MDRTTLLLEKQGRRGNTKLLYLSRLCTAAQKTALVKDVKERMHVVAEIFQKRSIELPEMIIDKMKTEHKVYYSGTAFCHPVHQRLQVITAIIYFVNCHIEQSKAEMSRFCNLKF